MSDQFVGSSSFALNLPGVIRRLAKLQATVVVSGETGTGKSIVASMLHEYSQRSNGPLVTFDCTTTPEALFESELFGSRKGSFTGASDIPGLAWTAKAGTLWLEEIGELGKSSQVKLLRMLDGKYRPLGARIDEQTQARIIATTNRDLKKMVADGQFRPDLFYRLERFKLWIPPLRQRPEDVLPLLNYYVENCELSQHGSLRLEVHEPSLARLKDFPWPGNVRELETVVLQTLDRCRGEMLISTDDLADTLGDYCASSNEAQFKSTKLVVMGGTLAEIERRAIAEAYEQCDWSIPRTAKRLKISRRGLQNKMTRYGIQIPEQLVRELTEVRISSEG